MARPESIEDKLLRMKKQIEQARSKIDQTTGAINQLMSRLQSEFGVNTIEEAKELQKKLEVEKTQLDDEIAGVMKKLEENYEWE